LPPRPTLFPYTTLFRSYLGRLLTELDDQRGCGSPGAVLSHGFWRTRFGGNPSVIGQTIMLDRRPFRVIGVTPRGFFGVEVGRTRSEEHTSELQSLAYLV